MGRWPLGPTEKPEGKERAAARPGLRGQWLVPGGPEGRRRGWGGVSSVSGRCSEAIRKGPPAGPGRLGGKGPKVCELGSIGLEQVAAFRALGEPSPRPSVTACPPAQHPVLSPGGSELCRPSGDPGRVRSGSRGGQEGAGPTEQESCDGALSAGVARAPRPTGLAVPNQPPSRRLGLWQGSGRLGGLPHPRFCPQLSPPARQPD